MVNRPIELGWDLMVLDPILIILGIIGLSFMVIRERTSLKWVLSFFATLTFWFANAMIVKMNFIQLNNGIINQIFSNPVWITLLFLGSASLISIILKPLATWLTGKVHKRKWWMFLAFIGLILSLLFTLINQANNFIVLYVLVAICLGFSLSANSLYFLTLNEQIYYRIAPILSAVIVSITITFATFLGNYFVDLENQFFALGTNRFLVLSTVLSFISLTAFGVIFAFFQKEDPTYVSSFELSQLKQLPKYTNYKLLYLIVAMILLGTFFGITQSSLTRDYLQALLLVKGPYLWQTAEPWLRTFNQFYIIPQFLLGYWIYKQISLRFGLKPVFMGLLSLSLLSIILIVFLDNPYVFVIFNFILGLTFSQIFYYFFGIAMMWNYRSKNIPVTGLLSGSAVLGGFVVELIIQLLKTTHAGIFKDYLPGPMFYADAVKFQQLASPSVIISFGIVGAFCIFAIVGLFFSFKYIFADYESLISASQNVKMMLRDQQRTKSRTRVLVNEVKIFKESER